jgi:hypothetical protein
MRGVFDTNDKKLPGRRPAEVAKAECRMRKGRSRAQLDTNNNSLSPPERGEGREEGI